VGAYGVLARSQVQLDVYLHLLVREWWSRFRFFIYQTDSMPLTFLEASILMEWITLE
jgi:hypothetical protein